MIVIQDDMLRDVIARTLHISEEEITEEKLLELKGLSARYAGITSLEGLQHAENLEYLDLCGNSIEILDPIRDLLQHRAAERVQEPPARSAGAAWLPPAEEAGHFPQ